MVLLSAVTLLVPRRYALTAFVIAACFIPTDQRLIIIGLHFTVLRVLVLAGVIRILLRGEYRHIAWNSFDLMVLAWALCGAIIYVLQWANMAGLINRLGFLFDVLGLYWIFRQYFISSDDMAMTIRSIAVCGLFLSVLVAVEWTTGRNPFAVLGKEMTTIREGRVRCHASFPHAIMLGLFWANAVPLLTGFLLREKRKILLVFGALAAVFMVVASASSTPIITLGQIILLLLCFKFRRYSTVVFWCAIVALFILHLVMNHPVWHLICRFNVISGSTGWHRFYLIDQAMKHIDEWAVLGTRSTDHWGYGLGDVTNQYVLEGVRGGMITLVLFIAMLLAGLKRMLNLSLIAATDGDRRAAWCICAALVGHCLSFIGVSYFGQIIMLLYLTLAAVGASYDILGGRELQTNAAASGIQYTTT